MTPTAFKGIVVLDTQAQFEQLSTTGTLVIGTETITYQPTSYLYYVKEGGVGVTQQELNEAIADLEAEIPTALSQLTEDSTHRTVTDNDKAAWNLPVVKTGTLNPVSSTVADFVGQFFLNTVYGDLFQCTAISSGVYTWKEVGGGGGGGSTPIYSHRVEASNGEAKLIIQFYSTTEAFGDVSEFNDFLGNQQRTITGYYKNSSGNYETLYTVQQGLSDGAIAFYFYANGVEPTFSMLTDITTFNDYSDEI